MTAYIDGHNRAMNGDKVEPPTDDEFDAMLIKRGLATPGKT